jgi:ribosomal-protein-alanine N-acetyltransferase
MTEIPLPDAFPFTETNLPYNARWMQVDDIKEVMPIEEASFPAPWPASAYRYELTRNKLSSYLVLQIKDPSVIHPRPIVAYGGFWVILDEGHISTIAVRPDWRGHGLGEWMLVVLMDAAILRGAEELTLEVRVSNHVAQSLYRKYAFAEVGRRKRYYHDNNEDALIMTTPRVSDPAFAELYVELKETLCRRMRDQPR